MRTSVGTNFCKPIVERGLEPIQENAKSNRCRRYFKYKFKHGVYMHIVKLLTTYPDPSLRP
jgi:hypothetical protein